MPSKFSLVGIALLAAPFSLGRAEEAPNLSKVLRGIEQRAQGIRRKYVTPCPQTLAGLPDRLLFIFEGAHGYHPRANYLLQSLHEVESQATEPMAKGPLRKRWEHLQSEAVSRTMRGTIPVPLVIANRYQPRKASAASFHWLYYGHPQWEHAVSCAKKLEQIAKDEGRTIDLRILGFSMGGHAAFQFTEALLETDLKFSKALTVDPVGRRGLQFAWATLQTRDNPHFKKPANVERWSNVYQKSDHHTLFVGIRGSRVIGADDESEMLLYNDHMELGVSPEAEPFLKAFFR